MAARQQFEVRKDDLAATRTVPLEAIRLEPGAARIRIERFALTANNITYGVFGDRIGYWRFFPASEGYGVIPVWGIGQVAETRAEGLAEGERLYGFLPMASDVVMRPDRLRTERFIDAAPHRAGLPAVYNSYARLSGEPPLSPEMEDARMLLYPLYATSFCIADFLADNDWFGAERIIVTSASSKTAIGLAYALRACAGAPASLGLTSARSVDRLRGLRLYDDVLSYDEIGAIAPASPTVIVDMSGDGALIAALHVHLGAAMRHTANVGATHYEALGPRPGFIAERSAMFFAPAQIEKRARDWGPGAFEARTAAFWREAAQKSLAWLKIERARGFDALAEAYRATRAGALPADSGVIVEI